MRAGEGLHHSFVSWEDCPAWPALPQYIFLKELNKITPPQTILIPPGFLLSQWHEEALPLRAVGQVSVSQHCSCILVPGKQKAGLQGDRSERSAGADHHGDVSALCGLAVRGAGGLAHAEAFPLRRAGQWTFNVRDARVQRGLLRETGSRCSSKERNCPELPINSVQ